MTKVYLLTDATHCDSSVFTLFSSRDKAEAAKEAGAWYQPIEEFEVDDQPAPAPTQLDRLRALLDEFGIGYTLDVIGPGTRLQTDHGLDSMDFDFDAAGKFREINIRG